LPTLSSCRRRHDLVGKRANRLAEIGCRNLLAYDGGGAGQCLAPRTDRLGANGSDQVLLGLGDVQRRAERSSERRHQDRLLFKQTRNALARFAGHTFGFPPGLVGKRAGLIPPVVQLSPRGVDSPFDLVLRRRIAVAGGLAGFRPRPRRASAWPPVEAADAAPETADATPDAALWAGSAPVA